MDKWQGKVAIVTGASSGIGASIAEELVRNGVNVVGLARREDRIKDLAKGIKGASGKLFAFKADLSKEDDILAAFAWVKKEFGGADILVNNAGMFKIAGMADGKREDWRAMLDINVLALCTCSREYLNSMKARDASNGHIININSIAGHKVDTYISPVYFASKFAVTAICESLRREIHELGTHIKVTSISPAEVATDITLGSPVHDILNSPFVLKPKDVAACVINALSASHVAQIAEMVITPLHPKVAVHY